MLYQKILYHSEIGPITILSDDHYIRKIEFGKRTLDSTAVWSEKQSVLQEACRQLTEYFAGIRRTFSLPLAPSGTPFQKAVWTQLAKIPFGQMRTYSQLADEMGRPGIARAIGSACHKNPIMIIIPCHRVIGANGSLTGYAAGLDVKEYLLALEQQSQQRRIDRRLPSGESRICL